MSIKSLLIPWPFTTLPTPTGVQKLFVDSREVREAGDGYELDDSVEGRIIKAILLATHHGLEIEEGKAESDLEPHDTTVVRSPHDTTIANQARRIDMLETGHRHWRGQCRILKLKIAEYERGITRRYAGLRDDEKKWDELQDYLSKASGGSIPSTDSQHSTHRAVGLHNVRDTVERVINGSPDNPRLAVDPDADMFESEVRKLIHSRIGANNVSSEQCKAIASAMRTAGFVRLRQ